MENPKEPDLQHLQPISELTHLHNECNKLSGGPNHWSSVINHHHHKTVPNENLSDTIHAKDERNPNLSNIEKVRASKLNDSQTFNSDQSQYY